MFAITRINENDTKMLVSGGYEDRHEAEDALDKILAAYPHSGFDEKQGYWWAWENSPPAIKFFVELQ
jgi:hypothetical protein